ncbi:hypothetical protein V6N13_089864 [Hibiscus sabdariffa]|uniref:Xylanase inhibitor C-terminal domain-containing protein n=1 Tax=Hibiscus sabdariffa TaxID=183260 RepID=A0ABR2QJ34_9ROSI
MAGLGRSKVSMPSLFSFALSFPRKFAVCLGSSNGVRFFVDGPYNFLAFNTDISKSLVYTPLVLNLVSTRSGRVSFEGDPPFSRLFIGVTSISINEALNKTLLSIDKQGHGGTMINTIVPYTVMQTSIYKAVVRAFTKELPKALRVRPVTPIGACFNSKGIGTSRLGPGVPIIDLHLPNKVAWRIFGFNSMVKVKDDMLCLGFLDGGFEATTSIMIG